MQPSGTRTFRSVCNSSVEKFEKENRLGWRGYTVEYYRPFIQHMKSITCDGVKRIELAQDVIHLWGLASKSGEPSVHKESGTSWLPGLLIQSVILGVDLFSDWPWRYVQSNHRSHFIMYLPPTWHVVRRWFRSHSGIIMKFARLHHYQWKVFRTCWRL